MRRILVLIPVCLVCWSCSTDMPADTDNLQIHNGSEAICFSALPTTKGSLVDDASGLTDIGVFCAHTGSQSWTETTPLGKMSNDRLTRGNEGIWKSSQTWDAMTADDQYTFFAYAPYGHTANGVSIHSSGPGTPTLSYTVPDALASQPDLLLAVPRKNIRQTNSAVSLQLKHALTAIAFHIKHNDETIESITITGINKTGTTAIDGGDIRWNTSGPGSIADFSSSLVRNAEAYTTKAGGYLMMLPQSPGNAKVIINKGDDPLVELSLALEGGSSWQAGSKITYHITLEKGAVPPPAGSISYVVEGSVPLVYIDNTDKNNADGMTWAAANSTCPAGYHLPRLNELQIVWIYKEGFANPGFVLSDYGPLYDRYWSSTPAGSGQYWFINMDSGNHFEYGINGVARVRCVAKAEGNSRKYPYVTEGHDANGPVIVSREESNGANGLSGSGNNGVAAKFQVYKSNTTAKYAWSNRNSACNTLPGGNWRVPTQREMMLIWVMGGGASYSSDNPHLADIPLSSTQNFNTLDRDVYWSDTSGDARQVNAYRVDMTTGVVTHVQHSTSAPYLIRCVRTVTD